MKEFLVKKGKQTVTHERTFLLKSNVGSRHDKLPLMGREEGKENSRRKHEKQKQPDLDLAPPDESR
jgi:hypothetical protein